MNPAIKKCLEAIRAEQLPDGGFLHQSWVKDGDEMSGSKTTFFAANILVCLNSVAESFACPELAPIRESAARFLLAQQSEHGSFNYWAHGSHESQVMPYPDDLDDTFMALAALHGFDATLIGGAAMAHIAKILTAVEVVPGGPYWTWLVAEPEKWRDVDIVVNSNVGYCLSRLGVALPNLAQFVGERICDSAGNLHSPYYPGAIQVFYFVARFYHGVEDSGLDIEKIHDKKAALADIVSREPQRNASRNEVPRNLLETAMLISVLIDLDCADAIAVHDIEIFAERCEREKFQLHPFCIDPSRAGQVCHAGSAALTAAFCAEALAKYARFHEVAIISCEPCLVPSQILLSRIKMMAQAKCFGLPGELKALALGRIDDVGDAEIVMVPYTMHHTLGAPQNISSRLLDELALANLFGWMAYTIYDNVLDGEAGASLSLSAANFFLRSLTLQYAVLDAQIPGLLGEYMRVMNIIDDANVHEQLHCGADALPRTDGDLAKLAALADRSFGHAFPALAVLFAAGYTPDSREACATMAFFRNYLAARQLHDDAHDWKEDLLRGRITSVVAQLIAIQPTVDQKLFWREVIPGIVADIQKYLEQAREAISGASDVFKNPASLFVLLDRLEFAAQRTLRERDEALRFLEVYAGEGDQAKEPIFI